MDVAARRCWMSVLATAAPGDLERAWTGLADPQRYTFVRAPEVGLVMVRGRAGGTGVRFNLGELPVSRCSVRLADGTIGHAYVGGRSLRHAEIAATGESVSTWGTTSGSSTSTSS